MLDAMESRPSLCIVGLGYVGLPLAHGFAEAGYKVSGYDISTARIEELKQGVDRTNELTAEQLQSATISLSADPAVIEQADVVIVALPTPVDERNNPDLAILLDGTKTVGKYLKKGAIVVYESTVYPGTTEEICAPVLEAESGLTCGTDFTLGYSPERINPGDKQHTLRSIIKIVAGQDAATSRTLVELYGSVVQAGIHEAPSIKVAEMAKAIENAQRDLNIAFINEIAMLCNHIDIPTKDVLESAGTKWNFLRFQPGLVGGHCIGVDPYYLVEKARQLGMQTHVIAAGRAVNDGMSTFVADRVHGALEGQGRVLVLGLTFKENVPDTRNSKSGDVIAALTAHGHAVEVLDPYVSDADIARRGWTKGSLQNSYDAILLLVPHQEFVYQPVASLLKPLGEGGLLYDLKSLLKQSEVEATGRRYMAL